MVQKWTNIRSKFSRFFSFLWNGQDCNVDDQRSCSLKKERVHADVIANMDNDTDVKCPCCDLLLQSGNVGRHHR
jgi:hypothetical protein